MNRKKKIEQNFSRASKTYNFATATQKMVAEKLVSIFPDKNFDNILEVGAGTGHLTNLLLKKFSKSSFLINDISQKMLDEIHLGEIHLGENHLGENHLDKKEKIQKLVCDGEKLSLKNSSFDLITSSSVFQWFEDYPATVLNFYNILKDGGELVFSMYGQNTLKELKEVFAKFAPNYNPNLEIKSFEEIAQFLENAGFKIELKKEEFITKQFLSLSEILKHQKLSGAVNVNQNDFMISRKIWGDIIEDYKKSYSKNGGVIATYHIYYFRAIKA